MLKTIHPIAGGLALALVAAFWTATVAAEIAGSVEAVVAVKTAIPWGLLLLIPALAAAGGSGFALGRGRGGARLDAKRRRMRVAAANGLLVLVPAALFLAAKAEARAFDAPFVAAQAAELAAGAVNLALIGLNMRDGLAMRRRAGAQG